VVPFRGRRDRWFLFGQFEYLEIQHRMHTDVYMRLVTREGSIVPHAVHVSARALQSQSILDRVDATLVPRGAHKHS
jgi:hypothetical protein